MKIAVIGYSGCGKSTLARFLGAKYGIDVLYLDRVHWLPGWQEREREAECAIVAQFMDKHDDWVIDGNYRSLSYQRRLAEADQIIWMNFNRISCLFRTTKRFLRFRGKTRSSMGPGCPEKLDLEFIRWVLYGGRTAKLRAHYQAVAQQYRDKTVILRNQAQLNDYIAGLL